MAIVSILIGLVLGFGAVQELVGRGIRGGEVQPGIVGAIGAVASALLIASGIAMWRRSPHAPRLMLIAALLSIALHTYAALPPHQNAGPLALLLGTGYGIVLLVMYVVRTRRERAVGVG